MGSHQQINCNPVCVFGICLSGNRPSVCPSVNSIYKDPSVRLLGVCLSIKCFSVW